MEHVISFLPNEDVRLDPERLELLYNKLGEEGADNVLSRAMEEMAVRIKQCERMHKAGSSRELRKSVHSLIAISEQIGMQTLADVAEDVTRCIDSGDWVALGSTFARLVRTSEQSLTAIWDLQDDSF